MFCAYGGVAVEACAVEPGRALVAFLDDETGIRWGAWDVWADHGDGKRWGFMYYGFVFPCMPDKITGRRSFSLNARAVAAAGV